MQQCCYQWSPIVWWHEMIFLIWLHSFCIWWRFRRQPWLWQQCTWDSHRRFFYCVVSSVLLADQCSDGGLIIFFCTECTCRDSSTRWQRENWAISHLWNLIDTGAIIIWFRIHLHGVMVPFTQEGGSHLDWRCTDIAANGRLVSLFRGGEDASKSSLPKFVVSRQQWSHASFQTAWPWNKSNVWNFSRVVHTNKDVTSIDATWIGQNVFLFGHKTIIVVWQGHDSFAWVVIISSFTQELHDKFSAFSV